MTLENILFYGVLGLYFGAMILYFLFVAAKKEGLSKAAVGVQVVGLVLHTAAIVLRGVVAGRLPLTNQYEFATAFAWGLCLVSLVFILKFKFTILGAFAAPVTFLIIGYAALQSKEIRALMPALQSNWLGFHVSTAIIAYGAFGVSCVLGVIFLLRERMKQSGFLDQHIPSREKLDMLSYRSVALGLLFLTFTIITGACTSASGAAGRASPPPSSPWPASSA